MTAMVVLARVAGAALVVVGAVASHAQTFDVKQLEVKKGELELSSENTWHRGIPAGRADDFNRAANEPGLQYGLHSWWRIGAILKFEKPAADDERLGKAALENIFVLRPVDEKRRVDFGLGWFHSIEASTHHDTTNSTQFGPILTVKLDKLSLTANPFLEKTFGRNHIEGTALVYGWNAKYELREGFAVGVEGFGYVENLGHAPAFQDQEHRIGPAIFAELELARDVKIAPDLGLLFGLTRGTPDVALKLNVGIPLYKAAGKD